MGATATAPVLKWSEMAWWLKKANDFDPAGTYLGEAGNSRRHHLEWVSAMRIGDEVLIQSPGHYSSEMRSTTIPAATMLKGFGEELDGKTLAEVLDEGVHYNYTLMGPVSS